METRASGSGRTRSPGLNALLQISARNLWSARTRSVITCGLIAIAALAVSCAGGATSAMADAIVGAGTGGHEAWVTLRAPGGCTECRRQYATHWDERGVADLRAAMPSGATLAARNWQQLTIRAVGRRSIAPRVVPLLCVESTGALPATEWADGLARSEWRTGASANETLGLLGAAVAGAGQTLPSQRVALRTDRGVVSVIGSLAPIPDIALGARLNGALVIAAESQIGGQLCRGRATELLVRGTSDHALAQVVDVITSDVRSRNHLHPAEATPLVVLTDDRIQRLIRRLSASVGRWGWVAPVVIAFVSAISTLAVNLVYGVERVSEFAVMRAVGARRRDLLGQLVMEAALLSAAAVLLPLLGTLLALVAADATRDRWMIELFALGGGLLAASCLTAVGVVVPGMYAAQHASLSSLERVGL